MESLSESVIQNKQMLYFQLHRNNYEFMTVNILIWGKICEKYLQINN